MVKVGEYWVSVIPVKVVRVLDDGRVDVLTEDGSCFLTIKENLVTQKSQEMKAMKDAVLTVAKQLCKANNTTTTLEIKNELRRDYPYYFWTQDVVSKYMDQLAGDGVFTYIDNRTFRTYSLVNIPSTKSIVPTTKTVATGFGNKYSISKPTGSSKRGRPSNKIDGYRVMDLAKDPKFESVTLYSGAVRTKADIKGQKKSPYGYIAPKAFTSIAAIRVDGKTYLVK